MYHLTLPVMSFISSIWQSNMPQAPTLPAPPALASYLASMIELRSKLPMSSSPILAVYKLRTHD